jgi:hypothetical protein
MRAPALSTVISAWESSSKLISKGLLDDMLDIFKSGWVKHTVRNEVICLDSRIGSVVIKSKSNIGADAYHLQCVVFFSWWTSAGLVEFDQVERLDEMLLLSLSPKRSLSLSDSTAVLFSPRNTAVILHLGAGDFVRCW